MSMSSSLEPEELGAKLLFIAKRDRGMFSLGGLEQEIWNAEMRGQPTYLRNRKAAVALALAEAWAWLEAQGLMIPAPDQGHGTSYRVLSRRARRFQSEAEFASYAVARMLTREALHPKIAEKVWHAASPLTGASNSPNKKCLCLVRFDLSTSVLP